MFDQIIDKKVANKKFPNFIDNKGEKLMFNKLKLKKKSFEPNFKD